MLLKTTLKWMIILAVGLPAARASAQEAPAFKSEKEKVSYAIGVELAGNLKRQGVEVAVNPLIEGLRDGLSGDKLRMGEGEVRKLQGVYHSELRRKQAELRQQQLQTRTKTAEDNRKVGEVFLAENKAKEGVVTLPSGLQYKILKTGEGKKPSAADSVECHYRGTLLDGTEFDSSYRAGKPAVFKVTGVIAGWKEALQLMPVGSKWQLFIPPQLAYGERGAGRDIGPNATLVFELELLAIR